MSGVSGYAAPAPSSISKLNSKFRSFLAQRADVSAKIRGRRMTPASLLLKSFRSLDVGNKNECSFDDFCKSIDSTVPWPDVQELWVLWTDFFVSFCSEHFIQNHNCSRLRYLLFVFHHCGQDGLLIADVSSIAHETQAQLKLLSSTGPHDEHFSSVSANEAAGSPAANNAVHDNLPAVPHVVAEGLRSILSALLSSSFVAAFDRCRSSAIIKDSRIIMSSAGILQAISDQHLQGEGSVCLLLLTLMLQQADMSCAGVLPFEDLCQFMRVFQVTLTLKDQKLQSMVQYFSSAEGDAVGFGQQMHASTPIHYRRWLAHIRGPLPPLRHHKLQQLFQVLDHGNKGFLSVEDVSSALQYSMVSVEATRKLGHASAMIECSKTLIDLMNSVSSSVQREQFVQKSVNMSTFVEFYHALSSSISRNPVFFAILYKMWERGLENPGDLLDTSNINFRRSKVFDSASAAIQKNDPQDTDSSLISRQKFAESHVSSNSRQSGSPSLLANQAFSIPASPDGFIHRLQSPKFMDERHFSSRKAAPQVSAFDGAAGVASASGSNSRMYSHLNRGNCNLPLQYDPEIDSCGSVRRKLVCTMGDHSAMSVVNGVEASAERGKHESPACAGVFGRIRGLLRQERATLKYKSSRQSSLGNANSMNFVNRWNNFIWIAANVLLEDARASSMTATSVVEVARSCSIQGTLSVEGFSKAMDDTSIHLTDSELKLLGQQYQSVQRGHLKYPEILIALISLTNSNRESKKRSMWQGIESASGFCDRVPLANVFKSISVARHPLVANHMCDAGDASAHFSKLTSHFAVRNVG
jgi:Ca2+-binding EF-hand superfamily protein